MGARLANSAWSARYAASAHASRYTGGMNTDAPHDPDFWTALAARRNHTLRRLVTPGPDASQLARIVEAGAHAPDHGLLRPWRFVLIPVENRADLGEVFAQALLQRDPACDDEALATARDKAHRAPCLIVAVLKDDPEQPAIARHEKLVSLGCAIQNMLVASQLLGFDSGLASGAAMDAAGMRSLLRLKDHEQAICFIGFGTSSKPKPPRPKPDAADYLSSL